jgi:hypothetical protein
MRKVPFLLFFLTIAKISFAQTDINNQVIETSPLLCKPGVIHKSPSKGVAFTYSFNPDYKMRSPDAEKPSSIRRNERFDTQIKVPLVNKPKLKVLLGFQYILERYHFRNIVPENYPLFKRLNDTDLKNTAIAGYVVFPINHKYYTSFRLSANWQGDYSSFVSLDSRYAVYRLAGVFGVKKRENVEYGVGLLLSKGFRNTSAVPFGFYNHTFNDHWGLEATIPSSIKVRYNLSERTIALAGTEFSSQTYAMKVSQPSMNPFIVNGIEKAPYHYQRTSLDAVATVFQHLGGWAWVQVKGGYAFNLNSEARDLPERRSYDLKPSGAVVGMVSLFLTPPRKYLN